MIGVLFDDEFIIWLGELGFNFSQMTQEQLTNMGVIFAELDKKTKGISDQEIAEFEEYIKNLGGKNGFRRDDSY